MRVLRASSGPYILNGHTYYKALIRPPQFLIYWVSMQNTVRAFTRPVEWLSKALKGPSKASLGPKKLYNRL